MSFNAPEASGSAEQIPEPIALIKTRCKKIKSAFCVEIDDHEKTELNTAENVDIKEELSDSSIMEAEVTVKIEPEEDPLQNAEYLFNSEHEEDSKREWVEVEITPDISTLQDHGAKRKRRNSNKRTKKNMNATKTNNSNMPPQEYLASMQALSAQIQADMLKAKVDIAIEQQNRVEVSPSPVVCETCKKTFKNIYNLIQHSVIHTGEKPFKCEVCKFKFIRNSHLKRHIKVTHPDYKPPVEENVIKKPLKRKRRLRQIKLKIFTCYTCSKVFKRRAHLLNHLLTHTGERPFACNICGKTFTEKGNLSRHIQLHSGEKPYMCDDCGKSFSSKNNLLKHIIFTNNSGISRLRHDKTCIFKPSRSSIFGAEKFSEDTLLGNSQFHSGVKV